MSSLKDVFDSVVADKVRTIPDKARVIETARSKGRILALRGVYDYLDQVLPHCYAAEKQLLEPDPHQPPSDLERFDVVMVGCPATLAIESWGPPLARLLAAGGLLVTTDWGLHNLVQLVFPGTIARQGSAEGSFALRVRNPASPLLQGIEGCAGTPWVVEAGSDRIGILDPKRVEVVLDAPEMGEPSPVLVTFPVGRGLVVHAISHFHLQGSAESGVYISAYLLTNIVDEAVRRRHLEPPERRVKIRSVPATGKAPAPPGRVRILKSR
jgi:hypothetical protein